jgi:flagellar M-ring protein FliF
VEGLEPNQVTVASTDGTVLHAAGEDGPTSMGSRQLRMTSDFESALSGDINEMLSSLLGPGRASVIVRAELDFDERSTESETYSPDSATPIKSQLIEESFNGDGVAPAGSVGVDGTPIGTGDGAYEYLRNEDTTEFGIDRVVVRTNEAPGTVQRLSVAVVVDDGSLTGASAPDVASIEALVSAAIGSQAQRGDTVEVSAAAFPALPEVADVAEEAETGGVMSMIPTIIGGLVLVLATVGLFLMSRSGKKKAKKGEIVETQEALPSGGRVLDANDVANQNTMLGLTEDVAEMVDRQPEEIAVLLRSWLADRREAV